MSDENVIIDRHLYLTEDQSRVVEEGDPAGRWLWASPGSEVKRRDAEQLGALKADSTPEPDEAKPKQRAPRANKQRTKPGDKESVVAEGKAE